LNAFPKENNRNGCLVIFRDDAEKNIKTEFVKKIEQKLKKTFSKVTISSMDERGYVQKNTRNKEVKNKFMQFQKSELVVTDRLHGMIFAAITGTPCIVFSNTNYKIKGVYEKWLKKYKFTQFIDNEDIQKIHIKINEITNLKCDSFKLNDRLFEPLIKELKKDRSVKWKK